MVRLPTGHKSIQYIQAYMNAGLGVNKIQRQLKGTEFGVRRQNLIDTIHWLRGTNKKAQAIKYVRKDYRPPDVMFPKNTVYQRKKYMYQVKIKGWNMDLKQWETTSRRVGSNKIRTKTEVEDFEKDMLEDIYYTNFQVTLEKVWKK